jgi:DNA uptake protein ComE-like DNA-binding protein
MSLNTAAKSHFLKDMTSLGLPMLLLLGIAGCNGNPPTHQQVQQQAAQTTVAVKQDAKEAVDATRKAAANAEADVNDVATGVKQGLHEDAAKPADKVNLNSATLVELAMLPGISFTKAGDIVKKRPYVREHDLVSRGVLSEAEYSKIEPQITVE